MCVCLPYVPFLFPSRYTTSSIRLHTYVLDVPLNELPQRLADTLFHGKSSFCCAGWCLLVAVESRLMVRPWTYVCRRIEEVVFLEGKRKRTSSFLLGPLLPLYVHIRMSTDVTLSELPQRLADTVLHSRMSFSCGKAFPLVAVEACLTVRPWTYLCRRIEEVVYLEGKRKKILFLFPSR